MSYGYDVQVERLLKARFMCSSRVGWDVYCLGEYHPWHGGGNPSFDEFSSDMLKVKKCVELEKWIILLSEKMRDFPSLTACVVPSHDPATPNSGIKKIVKAVCSNCGFVDGTDCIYRKTKVSPRHESGVSGTVDSLGLRKSNLIFGKIIVLFDDIITSGHSMDAADDMLRTVDTDKVFWVTLGVTC